MHNVLRLRQGKGGKKVQPSQWVNLTLLTHPEEILKSQKKPLLTDFIKFVFDTSVCHLHVHTDFMNSEVKKKMIVQIFVFL